LGLDLLSCPATEINKERSHSHGRLERTMNILLIFHQIHEIFLYPFWGKTYIGVEIIGWNRRENPSDP